VENLIPILGILTGIIIPVSVFIWLYLESKDKNKTILEISKHLNDPAKLEDLLGIFDERKKQPIDYRRGGVSRFLSVLASTFSVMLLWDLSLWVLDIW